MNEVIYNLSNLLPYLIIFPILSIILMLVLWLLARRSVTNKNLSFYGLFMDLSIKDVLSLSLLVIYYFMILESFFVTEFNKFTLIMFMVPIVLFNIVSFNGNILKNIFSLGNAILIYVLLFLKNIFYSYLKEIISSNYVIILLVILCIFIFLYSSYVCLGSLMNILKKNDYVKRKSV